MTRIVAHQSLVYPVQDYLINNRIDFAKGKVDALTVFQCNLTSSQQSDISDILQNKNTQKGEKQ